MTATYLDRILATHRLASERDERSTDALLAAAHSAAPTRGFREALFADSAMAIISEVKRRSPSKGELFPDLDPAVLARQYAAGGAACLSVLTDEEWFGGSVADLVAARNVVAMPVLRKDFTVHRHDVLDARIMGADCVLLIAAALDDTELEELHSVAIEVGLDVLIEIHDEAELDRAASVGAQMIGVNQRDLVTFEVDTARAVRLAAAIPSSVVKVAESGIRDAADVAVLGNAGYDAVLVGETLVTHGDPEAAVRSLRAGFSG